MWAFARNTGKDVGNRDRNSNITMIPNSSLSSLPKSVISIKRSDEDKQQKLMQICKVRDFCGRNAMLVVQSLNSWLDAFGNTPLHLTIMTYLLLLKGANPNLLNKSLVSPFMIAQLMGLESICKFMELFGGKLPEGVVTRIDLTKYRLQNTSSPINVRTAMTTSSPKVLPRYFNPSALPSTDQATVKPPVPTTNASQSLFGTFSTRSKSSVTNIEARDLVQSCLETGIMILPDAAYLGLSTPLLSVLTKNTIRDIDEGGSTILMKACAGGHEELVDRLIALGSDVDSIDQMGNTAIIWAVLSGHLQVVKRLVQEGASIEGAITFTKDCGITFIGQLTPLIAAVYKNDIPMINYLIKEHCDVNGRIGSKGGKSSIMIGAMTLKLDICKILLNHRAYVDSSVDDWLWQGAVKVKKALLDNNPWYGVVNDGKKNDSHQKLSERRPSLQDKMQYFSSEESELLTEIGTLLKSKSGVDPSMYHTSEAVEPDSRLGSGMQRKSIHGRNKGYRQALNLERIIGSNSESVMLLAEQVRDTGTELDQLWLSLFQCVVQLVMAANKNIKHHYIAIAAKANHSATEIVREIENTEKRVMKTGGFCDTVVKANIREMCKIISNELPKQLMLSTRMAIGVWPAPNAVSNMIQDSATLASACKELVLIGNSLGYFPKCDKKFDISFQPFEEVSLEEQPAEKASEKDFSLKGGLTYQEYKRQNDLKLIQELSKSMGISTLNDDLSNEEELLKDAEFFTSLDTLLKQFVGAAMELKQVHAKHLVEEFMNAASNLFTKTDNIIQEVTNFHLLHDLGDDILLTSEDVNRLSLSTAGIRSLDIIAGTPLKVLYLGSKSDVEAAVQVIFTKAEIASSAMAPTTAATDMLQSCIACVIAVKKFVTLAKETAVRVRNTGIEERRKRDVWRKECLANERVRQLFNMWENQAKGDRSNTNKKDLSQLDVEEIALLEDPMDGLILDDSSSIKRKVKGGRLIKLVEELTTHTNVTDEEFKATFIMTHHSFTTSLALMEMLIKRYDITPPYGLSQRHFEIYIDKKVVPVRLKVCHVFIYWIQNHFEEDFADNEFLVLRFRDFVRTKIENDFENMASQILAELDLRLAEQEPVKLNMVAQGDKPKPILPVPRFGNDPLMVLESDHRAIFDLDPLELARQLTLLEYELYCKFQMYECLDQIWEGQHRKEMLSYKQPKPLKPKRRTPGSANSDISRLISHTNEFSFWVASCVVNHDVLKARVNALRFFMSVAQHCKELNNLTGVTTIVAGLSMGPVSRMHKTWKRLEKKAPKLVESNRHLIIAYKELQELVSPKFQYSTYRKFLKDMIPPAIPFLGVFLTDLTFLDLGNPDFLPDSHFINFDKRRKVFQLTREIQKYQSIPFPLMPVPQIQDFMKKLADRKLGWDSHILDEDQLYELSTTFEPKEESSDEHSDEEG